MLFKDEAVAKTHFLKFTNSKNLEVILCSTGASVYAIYYKGRIMTMTPRDKEAFIADHEHYYGQTIGPLPMRLEGGNYKVIEKDFHFPPNENGNALHSSLFNYGFLPFAAEVVLGAESTRVIFKAHSVVPPEAGVCAELEVVYTIYENEDRFDLDYSFVPESDYTLNPTNHIYWNLGLLDIKELKLTMASSFHLNYDNALLCAKRRAEVTPIFDFKEGKKIGQDIFDEKLHSHATHGYDHYFFLDKPEIILESEAVRLTVTTSAEGVQVYTGNYPSEHNVLLGMDKACEIHNSGVTLETLNDPRPWGLAPTEGGQPFTQHNSYVFSEVTQ